MKQTNKKLANPVNLPVTLLNAQPQKPYEPDWSKYRLVDRVRHVSDAMDRFYKPDRLNRLGGTRERLIADRKSEFDAYGYTCIASHHDSINGIALYLKAVSDGLAVYGVILASE